MLAIKYPLKERHIKIRDLIVDGIKTYREKEAVFYNLRKANTIELDSKRMLG